MADQKKQLVTYIGLRKFGDEKVIPCFLTTQKKKVFFQKIKWARIGHLYEMENDKMKTNLLSEGRGQNPKITEEQIETWEAEEVAAKQFLRTQKACKKVDRLDLWDKSLSNIHRIAQKLSFDDQRELARRIEKLILWGK